MGYKKINVEVGDRFGELTIRDEVYSINGRRQFLCQCDCGRSKIIQLNHLRSGATRSCGCLNKYNRFKHGSKGRLYGIWKKMRGRCYRVSDEHYPFYGARNIKICAEWDDARKFIEWANSNGYDDKLTIDRIDNNGDYSPSNCRWVDMKVQSNNRRDNIYYDFNGKKMTIPEICRELDIIKHIPYMYYHVGKMNRDLYDTINLIKRNNGDTPR